MNLIQEAQAEILTEETIKTAAIEGQSLSRNSVRSSIARRLGLPIAGLPSAERHVDGLVEMILDATARYNEPLTAERLKGWQAALFPTGFSGLRRIRTGTWRGPVPMQVVSGPVGREKVHFEAPPADRIGKEITQFLSWWEASLDNTEGLLRAGMAHFRFITIHPFEDGNGRIARALTDMALAQNERLSTRFYSLSAQIMAERDQYSDHSAPFSGHILRRVFGTPRSGVLGILVFEFHLQSKTTPPGNPVEPAFRTTLQKTTNRGLEFSLSHVQIGKFQMVATLTNFTVVPPE